jgi:hypothetical protein
MSDAFLLKLTEQMLRENKKLKGTLSAKYRQGQKAGEQKERERITNLLTDSKVINTDQKYFLLAQIKGEKK